MFFSLFFFFISFRRVGHSVRHICATLKLQRCRGAWPAVRVGNEREMCTISINFYSMGQAKPAENRIACVRLCLCHSFLHSFLPLNGTCPKLYSPSSHETESQRTWASPERLCVAKNRKFLCNYIQTWCLNDLYLLLCRALRCEWMARWDSSMFQCEQNRRRNHPKSHGTWEKCLFNKSNGIICFCDKCGRKSDSMNVGCRGGLHTRMEEFPLHVWWVIPQIQIQIPFESIGIRPASTKKGALQIHQKWHHRSTADNLIFWMRSPHAVENVFEFWISRYRPAVTFTHEIMKCNEILCALGCAHGMRRCSKRITRMQMLRIFKQTERTSTANQKKSTEICILRSTLACSLLMSRPSQTGPQ